MNDVCPDSYKDEKTENIEIEEIQFTDGGNVTETKKTVIVHNNTNSAYDRDAQAIIMQYLKNLNDSGRTKIFE